MMTSKLATIVSLVRRLDLLDQVASFSVTGTLDTLKYRTKITQGIRYCHQDLLYILDYYVISGTEVKEFRPECDQW